MFRLKLFGGISLHGPNGPLAGRAVQRHRLALLALLGGSSSGGLSREKLIAFVWPDADPERARPLLSDSIYRINQAVGGEAISSVGDHLRLNRERLSCDAADFRDALQQADWERAVELHAAPFLDGFFLRDADEFERWAETERRHFAQEKQRALESLATSATDPLASVRWWRQLTAHDPFSSRIALELMRALERAGERGAAIQHAQIHGQLMKAELGMDAAPEVLAFAEQLRRAPTPRRSAVAAVPLLSSASPQELPVSVPAAPAPRWRLPVFAFALIAFLIIAAAMLLRREAGTAATDVAAIVVLPFADHSPRGDQEYFADGISEELMVRLAKLPRLKVVGRTSSFAFKGKSVDARDIAAQLHVDAILSGSVRVADKQLRITAQLVDAKSGFELWSDTYQRELADVLDIQQEIAGAIAARLGGPIAQDPARAEPPSVVEDADAYNRYLRGRFEWHKRTETGMRNAVTYLTEATQRAPTHARAHAGLGDAYAVLGFYDYLPPRVAFPQAKAAALRALQLDPQLAEAHSTLGYVALYYEWQWDEAERAFLRSIELNDGYSTAHQWYANFLTAMGRFDEAVREMRIAQDIDPLSLIANAALGWVWYYSGEYERAIGQLDRTLELNQNFELAHLWRALALQELKRFDEASASFERAVALSSGSAISTALLAQFQARAGHAARARELLASIEARPDYVPAFEIAKVHLALADRPAALRWLQRARDERSHSIAFLNVDPQLRELRTDPQFQAMLRAVNLAR